MKKNLSTEDAVFEELVTLIKKERKDISVERIQRAYTFAKKAHERQFRVSGDPYVVHPLETAKILAQLQVSEETVIAGLLHDVPEDTIYTVDDVEKRFGKNVARLVSALTKLSKVYYRYSMGARQVQSLRKIFLETANDVQVVIIKLADRLHNMQTLQYLRPEKQLRIAKETLEIYAPLANLYGIYRLRRKLEDLCFMYLQPEEYARIEAFVHDHEKKRAHFINDTIEVLKKELKKAGLEFEIYGRSKHFYSIYQKMIRDQKVLQDIYDYSAVRILAKDKDACYKTLGLVHGTFRPKPGRIKDYIALPKPNGYQSLHTTVVGLRGKLTEVQIRTNEMHGYAEYGAAAHTIYKDYVDGKAGKMSHLVDSIEQLRCYKNPESFINGLQEDVLQNRIYVFSPTGEIVNLPEGASCLDYIYAVNLPIDKKVFRAVVNNKVYSLTGELQSGDYVEIVYGNKDQDGPERWWLEHVKTSKAKEKIQEYFSKQSYKTKVRLGEELLQQELDHEDQGLIYQMSSARTQKAVRHFDASDFEKLLAQIGEGLLSGTEVYAVLFPKLNVDVYIRLWHWLKGWLVRFNSIDEGDPKYHLRILVEAYDRKNLLQDILQPFYDLNIPILKSVGLVYEDISGLPLSRHGPITGTNATEQMSRDLLDVLVESQEELITLFDRLEKVPGVTRVQRYFRRRQVSFVIGGVLTALYFVGHPFLIKFLKEADLAYFNDDFYFNGIIYLGLLGLFVMLVWLRSMGNKTFPHFEETRYFWPMAFGLILLAIGIVFVDDFAFGLHLHLPVMTGFSLLSLVYLYFSYRSHRKRRSKLLSRLKAPRMTQDDKKVEQQEA